MHIHPRGRTPPSPPSARITCTRWLRPAEGRPADRPRDRNARQSGQVRSWATFTAVAGRAARVGRDPLGDNRTDPRNAPAAPAGLTASKRERPAEGGQPSGAVSRRDAGRRRPSGHRPPAAAGRLTALHHAEVLGEDGELAGGDAAGPPR